MSSTLPTSSNTLFSANPATTHVWKTLNISTEPMQLGAWAGWETFQPSSNSWVFSHQELLLLWSLLLPIQVILQLQRHIQHPNFHWLPAVLLLHHLWKRYFSIYTSVMKENGAPSNPNRNHLSSSAIPAEHPAHGYCRSLPRNSDAYEEYFFQFQMNGYFWHDDNAINTHFKATFVTFLCCSLDSRQKE